MVKVASSSKSNQSQAIKFGPPTKKPDAVQIAKAKKSKQESIKKYARTGKYIPRSAHCLYLYT